MLRLKFVVLTLLFASNAFASYECDILDILNVVSRFQCEKSDGNVYHANGKYAGSKGNNWYHDI